MPFNRYFFLIIFKQHFRRIPVLCHSHLYQLYFIQQLPVKQVFQNILTQHIPCSRTLHTKPKRPSDHSKSTGISYLISIPVGDISHGFQFPEVIIGHSFRDTYTHCYRLDCNCAILDKF